MTQETIIRRERIRRGWNQSRLGFYADMPPQHVSAIERGIERCGQLRQERLASALGVEMSLLFTDSGFARVVNVDGDLGHIVPTETTNQQAT